jgi:hypothetical protein
VGGQSAYGWSAALGSLYSITNIAGKNAAAGDRIFVSSDHTETLAASYAFGAIGWGVIKIMSVNKAGSVPPVTADLAAGATITCLSSSFVLDALCNLFWYGLTFVQPNNASLLFNSGGFKANYLKNCALQLTYSSGTAKISNSGPATVTLDNTTVQFGAVGQSISSSTYPFEITWINTAAAVQGAIVPTSLFVSPTQATLLATCRGVDLSAASGSLLGASNYGSKVLLDGCTLPSSYTAYGTPSTTTCANDAVEIVNCLSGSTVVNSRNTPAGAVTTDTTTTMSGGAADDVGAFSHKMVSSSRSDIVAMPLESFWFEVENTLTGSSKTATIQIVSSASLNNTDIHMLLEYPGTSSSPVASWADSLPTQLDASAAVTTSSSTWTSPPSTPVYQQLAVTFTPRTAGRVRARVLLGKPSATVWVNPQVIIT